MASCRFEGGKCHGAIEAKALLRHCDISPKRRAAAQKKNKHIDLNKSIDNFSIFGLDYKKCAARYDARIAYVDSHGNKNKRRDRVTLQSIVIPVPADLERCQYNNWFLRVSEILIKRFGKENFIEGMIHYDEEHQYIDPETKEKIWSRVHGHFFLVPVPDTDNKLNAKKFSSRRNIKLINKEIDDMTRHEYRCVFMSGEKKRSFKTVEDLKNESAYAEFRSKIEKEEEEIEKQKEQLRAHREYLERRQQELDELEEEAEDARQYASECEHKARIKMEESEKLANELLNEAKEKYRDAVRCQQEAHRQLEELEKQKAAEEPEEIQMKKTVRREVPPEFERVFQRSKHAAVPDLDSLERRHSDDEVETDASRDAQEEEAFDDDWHIPFEFLGFVPDSPAQSPDDDMEF